MKCTLNMKQKQILQIQVIYISLIHYSTINRCNTQTELILFSTSPFQYILNMNSIVKIQRTKISHN